jgi:SNF2 family DNA or RNA helicase
MGVDVNIMNTFITRDGKRVIVPYHTGLANAVPHAKELLWQGSRMLVLPNAHDEAKVARNLGIQIPSPILTRYDWAGSKPWQIQQTTAALLTESARCYVLSSMGCGKTRAVLFAADYLIRTGQARRMLVCAPLSTLTPVWEKEIFTLFMRRYSVNVLHGSRDKRLELLSRHATIDIINHHGLKVILPELTAAGYDIVVLDELAVYRNKRTDLWSSVNTVLTSKPGVKYTWGLTGSPTPNAPTDAWAQVRLLTPERTTRTFSAFQDRTMRRVSTFRWVPKPEANGVVQEAMQPSVRYSREDVMELPPSFVVERAVTLEAEARKAYEMLYNKARMITLQGDSVSAVNEGVLQNKLLQVSCGFLYTDKHTVYALPNKSRLNALDEVLNETDRKVLVLVPFLHALTGVATHLRAKSHDIAVVHGGTSRVQRDKIFTEFQSQASPRVIVAHPQTLSHGLTLTEANVIVWYSPVQSLDIYEQANARINRPGQTSKTLIVHMVATYVERATYQRLQQKQRMQGVLLSLFKQQELAF